LKLASLKNLKSKDGELVVISSDNQFYVSASDVAPNLLSALDQWSDTEPELLQKYNDLNSKKVSAAIKITDENIFESCLPRTWLFADGSAFIHHIKLVRQARKAALPETLLTVPLMYQAECGRFLSPTENIPQADFNHGTDFEAEVGVIVDFVPKGITASDALNHIKLVVILNDTTLRGLIPEELASGFGFFQSKPNKTLSPFAVTIDELGSAWKDGRVHLPLLVDYNGEFFGRANAKEMHFHFGQLIAHAARTRDLAAGSLIGSGTVSNEDVSVGSSCLVEKRTLEQIHQNEIKTPYMSAGDTIEIKMLSATGENIFGRIYQKVQKI
jgi:fumarylacetoacetate (FAA) hydrolase